MGGMVSKAASSLPSGGGKSSPAPQNAYGSAYQAPSANVYQPSFQMPTSTSTPSGGKSSGMGASGYGMPIAGAENITAPQSQVFAPMPMMGGKFSGMGGNGYEVAPAFQQSQQQFNPFQQQQFNPFQQQQFNPFQQQQFNPFQQQQFNPFQQQPQFQQQQQGASGLQGLFNAMMNQQQMQQRPMQQYQDPALQYRPNMQNARAALSRVKPSVQKQQADAAQAAQIARIAELEAQLAAAQQPAYDPWNSNSGGG